MNNNIETVIDTNLIIAEALENDEYETTYEEGEEVEAQTEVPTKHVLQQQRLVLRIVIK